MAASMIISEEKLAKNVKKKIEASASASSAYQYQKARMARQEKLGMLARGGG